MSDTALVIIEFIKVMGAVAGIVLPIYLSKKLTGIHKQINSRMDQALNVKQELGNLEGRRDQRNEDKTAAATSDPQQPC